MENIFCDLVIVTLPPIGFNSPALGPALITAAVQKAGYSAKQIDFSARFYEKHKHNQEIKNWLTLDTFVANESGFIVPFLTESISHFISEIKNIKPRWIGLSLFTTRGFFILNLILDKIKHEYPEGKIVVGGSGVIEQNYFQKLLEDKKIDAYVHGEGEKSILEVLSGNLEYPGINGSPPVGIENLDEIQFADYSDLDFQKNYLIKKENKSIRMFFIEGSRGCVKKCSFCYIPFTKPGYRYRSTQSIITEVYQLIDKHDMNHIYFVDSLVNGSLKHLKELCLKLKEIRNTQKPDLHWTGYFIIRSEKLYAKENFKLLAESGAYLLKLGVESGSHKVRQDMNKFNSNEDIDYNFDQCLENNIGVSALIVVGFPTESETDFDSTKNFVIKHRKTLARQNSQISISWKVAVIDQKSDLSLNPDKYGIQYDHHKEWYSDHVNILISSKRYLDLCSLVDSLNIQHRNKFSKERVFDYLKKYNVNEADLQLPEQELKQLYLNQLN